MASSLQDPQVAHSLWLQRRSGRCGTRRAQWRSDWTPFAVVLILLGFLIILALFSPSNEAIKQVKQAAQQQGTGSQETLIVGVPTEQ